jgi:Winged helix-turn helix
MVLLSRQGLSAAQIAVLLECHPATVRRWIGRFNSEGRRAGRPAAVRAAAAGRAAADPADCRAAGAAGAVDAARIWRYLGRPRAGMRTLYRRVRRVAIWRRPRLTARGDPDHDHVVAGIVARLIELPRRAVVLQNFWNAA